MLFLSFYSFYSFHLKSLKMCTFYAYKQASQFNLRGTKVVFLYQNQFVSSFSFFPTLFSLLEPCMCITPLFSYLKRQQKALGPRVLLPKALLFFFSYTPSSVLLKRFFSFFIQNDILYSTHACGGRVQNELVVIQKKKMKYENN